MMAPDVRRAVEAEKRVRARQEHWVSAGRRISSERLSTARYEVAGSKPRALPFCAIEKLRDVYTLSCLYME